MGRVWKLGDNIDTDVITPTEYLDSRDVYVAHVLEPIRPEFADRVQEGDVVVAGKNFGCGSSRESAAVAFLDHGIEAVIARSFARIFYRNAINIGLAVYICSETDELNEGDEVAINHDTAVIRNETTNKTYQAEPHPEFIQNIIRLGGLRAYRDQLRTG